MTDKAKASICLKYCNSKLLFATISALKPEVISLVTHRANVELHMQDCFLILNITAEDTVALRAMVNTYLRWIGLTANVADVVEHM